MMCLERSLDADNMKLDSYNITASEGRDRAAYLG